MSLDHVAKKDPLLKWLQVIADANREEGTMMHGPGHIFSVFDCIEEPGVGVGELIDKACGVTRWELGMAIVLIGKLLKKCDESFNPLSAHRLLITALIISIKLQREVEVTEYFHRHTQLPSADLCLMERVFLFQLEWEVSVTREAVEAAVTAIDGQPLPHIEGGFVCVLPGSPVKPESWLQNNAGGIPLCSPPSQHNKNKLGPRAMHGPGTRFYFSRSSPTRSRPSTETRPSTGSRSSCAVSSPTTRSVPSSPKHSKSSGVFRVRQLVAESRNVTAPMTD